MHKGVLTAILILGLIPRLFSVHWNSLPHGDVKTDAIAAASFQHEGEFVVGEISPEEKIEDIPLASRYLVLHPPLWPLLGAGVNAVLGRSPTPENTFSAFRILSLLAGAIVIWLTFLVGRKLIREIAGLIAAGFVACSAIMIDYSGNGAFYGAHAALFLAWILVALRRDDWPRAILLGLVPGVAYILNYQTIILLPGSILLVLFGSRASWGIRFGRASVIILASLLIALPWMIRNTRVFGDPFFGHYMNNTYVFNKTGLPSFERAGIPIYDVGIRETLLILHNVFTYWLPNNLYYIARKLFILAPVMFLLFPYALIAYLFDWSRVRKIFPLLLVLGLHLLVSAAWPVTKFRYFVPMLPLIFLVSLEHLWVQRWSRRIKRVWIGGTFVALVALSILTYRAIPAHTYYYDGAITTDPFSGSEEMEFVREKYPHLAPPKGRASDSLQ